MPKILTDSDNDIRAAANIIKDGGVVAFPCETIFGLGADARNEHAIAHIYHLKQRPSENPLICHLPYNYHHILDDIINWHHVKCQDAYNVLSQKFWPGALTLILPLQENHDIAKNLLAGKKTIAIRVPNHPVAQKLISYSQKIIAAPSANPSGRISATKAEHVFSFFHACDSLTIINGEINDKDINHGYGVESTIIDLTATIPTILRDGAIAYNDIMALIPNIQHINNIQKNSKDTKTLEIKAPGMIFRHYAPLFPLIVNCNRPSKSQAYLGFGYDNYNDGRPYMNLSHHADLAEAAYHLFDYLFILEKQLMQQQDYHSIAVAPIPQHNIGITINDRLHRAAQAMS